MLLSELIFILLSISRVHIIHGGSIDGKDYCKTNFDVDFSKRIIGGLPVRHGEDQLIIVDIQGIHLLTV